MMWACYEGSSTCCRSGDVSFAWRKVVDTMKSVSQGPYTRLHVCHCEIMKNGSQYCRSSSSSESVLWFTIQPLYQLPLSAGTTAHEMQPSLQKLSFSSGPLCSFLKMKKVLSHIEVCSRTKTARPTGPCCTLNNIVWQSNLHLVPPIPLSGFFSFFV